MWKSTRMLFFHFLDLLTVLPSTPLVVQNDHINIPSGISQEPNKRGVKDVSTTDNPTGKTNTFHQPNDLT
jgi:hypothetical protein